MWEAEVTEMEIVNLILETTCTLVCHNYTIITFIQILLQNQTMLIGNGDVTKYIRRKSVI